MSWRAAFVYSVVGASAAMSAIPATARAEDTAAQPGFARRLIDDVRRSVDAAIVARPPKLVPPRPVPVKWKLAKLATFELGSPLVTLAGGDLDGDGTGELYAVTAREVIAYAAGPDKKLRERGRIAFSGERASIAPRDVVATTIVERNVLVAAASPWARSLRVTWKGGLLVGELGVAGFTLCPGEVATLAPGRNHFGAAATASYGTRCSDLVDNDGYPLRARSQLSLASRLDVAIERCAAAGLGCQPASRHEYTGVGFAFDVADVDRDGTPEVLYAAAGAPGDPEIFRVISIGSDDKRPRLKKAFATGGVAGIASSDLDGDGVLDAIVATRVVGASRVDLWRLE